MNVVSAKQDVEGRLKRGLLGQWYAAAKSVQVKAGRPLSSKIAGERVVMWRGKDGGVRCIEDFCPHRGARLSLGEVVENDISCRYHGVTMDGEGTIVKVPALANCALEGRRPLKSYPTREMADAVFIYVGSADQPVPTDEPKFPSEFTDPEWVTFLAMNRWKANYRDSIENVADPMHGSFLHANSFTLAYGKQQDTLKIERIEDGFCVKRVGQQGVNFDYTDMIMSEEQLYGRLDIPFPPAAGPGGPFRILAFTTPIDEDECYVFIWRLRKVSGFARESYRFLYRTLLESRHWDVLEQDREMIEALPADARRREMLYQHDIGVSRIRQLMSKKAKQQLEAERVPVQTLQAV